MSDDFDVDGLARAFAHKMLRDNRIEAIDFHKFVVDSSQTTLDGLVSHNAPADLVEMQRANLADYQDHLEKAEAELTAFDVKGPTYVP